MPRQFFTQYGCDESKPSKQNLLRQVTGRKSELVERLSTHPSSTVDADDMKQLRASTVDAANAVGAVARVAVFAADQATVRTSLLFAA